MIRLEVRNYDMTLIEKQPKYQLHYQVKFINMNLLLVGRDILPNQQQIIERARFTYSPSGKAFEKQIKTIEDQGQKQIDALKVLESKAIDSESNKPVITQNFYDKILEERMDEILKLSDKIDFDNLICKFKGPTSSIIFVNLEVHCLFMVISKMVIQHYNK